MKVLVFSDLHASNSSYRFLKKNVYKEKPDLLINCGDFTLFGGNINSWAKKFDFGIKMLTIPGNHESSREIIDMAKKFDYVIDIHKKVKRVDDVLFLGAGEGGFGDELSSLDVSEKKFVKRIKEFKQMYSKGRVVLVTHAPPYRTKQDSVYGEHVGAKNIRWFIRDNKLAYCFCGHIHENSKTKDKIGKTIIVNPGPSGMVFEI